VKIYARIYFTKKYRTFGGGEDSVEKNIKKKENNRKVMCSS